MSYDVKREDKMIMNCMAVYYLRMLKKLVMADVLLEKLLVGNLAEI
jgi:hypothetical protein